MLSEKYLKAIQHVVTDRGDKKFSIGSLSKVLIPKYVPEQYILMLPKILFI